MVYICVMHRKRKKRLREPERGPDFRDGDGGTGRKGGRGRSGSRNASRGKQGKGTVWWTGKGKGKERARSRSQSRPRGTEGLKNIELGPAAARSLLESGGLGTSGGAVSGSESFAEGYDVSGPLQGGRCRRLDEGVRAQGEWRRGRAKMICRGQKGAVGGGYGGKGWSQCGCGQEKKRLGYGVIMKSLDWCREEIGFWQLSYL